MVTLKAVRSSDGRIIEWNYDTPQQARRAWKDMTEGRTPDSGESIIRAYYFGPNRKPGDGPDKAWAS